MKDSYITNNQILSQKQIQRMSQKQIYALKLISMNNLDLRDEILNFAEENPAVEIVKDDFNEGISNVKRNSTQSSIRLSEKYNGNTELSDRYQDFLESKPDTRETLKEHLEHQLNMLKISEKERQLAFKLINNLDDKGFYFLAPETLLDKNDEEQNSDFLNKCIEIVRSFEPTGICCQNVVESLKIQAKQKGCKSPLVFLLLEHLEFINPPVPETAAIKIKKYLQEMERMSFQQQDFQINKNLVSVESVEKSINFIKTLNPFPAQDYGVEKNPQYIQPDALIKKNTDTDELEVYLSQDNVPTIKISENIDSGDFSNYVQNAKNFIETLEFRNKTVLKTIKMLVNEQKDFFLKGEGNLKPLTQKQFASIAEVSESTISRFAETKYIRCDWGTFPIKYFFTNALPKKIKEKDESGITTTLVSTESVKNEIRKLIEETKKNGKKLSDQKISDLLNAKGIKIARRTVAKYRNEIQ